MRLCICSIYVHTLQKTNILKNIFTHIYISIYIYIYLFTYTYTYLYRYMCITVTKWHVICQCLYIDMVTFMEMLSEWSPPKNVSAKPPKKPRTQSLHWWYLIFFTSNLLISGNPLKMTWERQVELNLIKFDWCNLLPSIPFRVTG